MQRMKVAFVHDWLDTYAGAERVLEQMIAVFPHADIFSLVDFMPEKSRRFLQGKRATTSFIQNLPFAKSKFRYYLPFFPMAIEQLDLRGYDLVVSSSFAVAKGVRTGPDQLHICMCYSPMRYVWDMQDDYLAELKMARGPVSFFVRWVLHELRKWDVTSSNGVDQFIAISRFISARIEKCYRRPSAVVYPPVAVDDFPMVEGKDDYYLTASRLVPYKRVVLIARAFAEMPSRRLVVIGEGPDLKELKQIAAKHANITVLGHQPFEVLKEYMQRARAFVFAAKEDFGIAPLEAQACGTPVIAFAEGGARETIRGIETPMPSGLFFFKQSVEAICRAVQQFETVEGAITPANCRRNAERFSPERFRREFLAFVNRSLSEFQHRDSVPAGILVKEVGAELRPERISAAQ